MPPPKNDFDGAEKYSIVVRWSEEDSEYSAQCIEIPGCTAGDREMGEAVWKAFEAIQINLDLSKEIGVEPPMPDRKIGAKGDSRNLDVQIASCEMKIENIHDELWEAKKELKVLYSKRVQRDYGIKIGTTVVCIRGEGVWGMGGR